MSSEETTSRIEQRLHSSGPKRLLALDGAGTRNAVTFPILEAMESGLQQQPGNSELRLCDYFDVIGGTNTGAVIAAMLARGMSVREAQEHFLTLCPRLFNVQPLYKRLTSKYSGAAARVVLMEIFGEESLDSERLQSGLCIFTYRLDEAAPFAFHNLPSTTGYSSPLLCDCLSASLASPTYFEPVQIAVALGEMGVFVDANLAMTGGAAVPLFLTTTSVEQRFQFPTGEKNLLLVAVGTGEAAPEATPEEAQDRNVIGWASALPSFLLADAKRQNEIFLRAISRNPQPLLGDEELSEVNADLLPSDPALTYVRFDFNFSALGALGLDELISKRQLLARMDNVEFWSELLDIGNAVAREVDVSHFPGPYARTGAFA
jgi:uncharacterized protein